jgi:hypothetical protein
MQASDSLRSAILPPTFQAAPVALEVFAFWAWLQRRLPGWRWQWLRITEPAANKATGTAASRA